MSSLYNLEPQPTAKVMLQTTAGDIELELFAKQTPLASRSFLQHCLDGYYQGSIFHRVVAGFIVQGGDPTGTGFGGESGLVGGEALGSSSSSSSSDGAPFADEFHSRLKFNRRGLLGMANAGKKDDNGSQFFFTLGPTPELQGKHTLFGRVVGDTIFNVIRMGEAECAEGTERPLYPTSITGADILVNPFEDMVKRKLKAVSSAVGEKSTKKKAKRKAGKALLSFGDEEGGSEDTYTLPLPKKPKFNTSLVTAAEEDEDIDDSLNTRPKPSKSSSKPKPKPKPSASSFPILKASPSAPPPRAISPKHSTAASSSSLSSKPAPSKPSRSSISPSPTSTLSPTPPPLPSLAPTSKPSVQQTETEIAALKASLRRGPGANGSSAKEEEKASKLSALEALIPSTSSRGGRRRRHATGQIGSAVGGEEARTFALFNAFRSKLDSASADAAAVGSGMSAMRSNGVDDANETGKKGVDPNGNDDDDDDDKNDVNDEDEAALCDLHFIVNCQSCSNWTAQGESDEDDGSEAWLSHKLSFAKDRLGKDLEWKRKNEEELVVVDPREKARELGVGKVGSQPKRREWDDR